MRPDDIRIALRPRRLGGAIDLAGIIFRLHFRRLFGMTCLFAIPCTLLVVWSAQAEFGLLVSLSLYFFLSPILGALIVAALGPWIFGEPISLETAAGTIKRRFGPLLLHVIIWRFVALFSWSTFALPGLFASAFESFVPETIVLEEQTTNGVVGRIRELGSGRWFDLIGRRFALSFYHVGLVVSVFLLAELISSAVFGYPLAFARAVGSAWSEELLDAFFFDAIVLGVMTFLTWILYPITRIAIFLSYLDIRIRQEAWDIELDFRQRLLELEAQNESGLVRSHEA